MERRVCYTESEDATLSETVLDAVEAYEDVDVARSEFVLSDAVDPDALDDLFRAEADADVVVEFTVDDARVTLLGDGGVDVRLSDPDEFGKDSDRGAGENPDKRPDQDTDGDEPSRDHRER